MSDLTSQNSIQHISTSQHPIIVIGASLGGMQALKTIFAQLPADLPASILVVWHMPPDSPNLLPAILQRATSLPVFSAEDNAAIQVGNAYIARPDQHLIVEAQTPDGPAIMRLTHGPKENRFRPSIDVLFRSAAVALGSRVIGVILTGALDDGAAGLYAVKECGGKAVVQDPLDAECPNMPINAMRAVQVDVSVPVAQMAEVLLRLVDEKIAAAGGTVQEKPRSQAWQAEVRISLEDGGIENGVLDLGDPSPYTCPDCHGVLMQIKEGNFVRFRCHTGHGYSLDSLLAEVSKSAEDALWNALRTIQETELLLTHLSKHLSDAGEEESARKCQKKIAETRHRADIIRKTTMTSDTFSIETLGDE